MKRVAFLSMVLMFWLQPAFAQLGSNQLAATVAAMAPGTWAQVPQDANSIWAALQCSANCSDTGPEISILGDAQGGAWDRRHNTFHFSGSMHTSHQWSVTWTAADNTWHTICGSHIETPNPNACGVEPDNAGFTSNWHGYQLNTVNPITGIHYWARLASYPCSTLTIDKIAPGDTLFTHAFDSGATQFCGQFTPTAWWEGPLQGGDPGGILMMYQSESLTDGYFIFWHPSTNTIEFMLAPGTGIQPGSPGPGGFNAFLNYSSKLNAAYLGGGNGHTKSVWIVNSARAIRQLDDAPIGTCSIGDRGYSTVTDPVTGYLIIMGGGASGSSVAACDTTTRHIYVLNPSATPGSQWTELFGANVPPILSSTGGVPTGVGDGLGEPQMVITAELPSPYNVSLWVSCLSGPNIGTCDVYVFKMDPGSLDLATKCNKPGVISCFNFDSNSATRLKPTTGEPVRYNWPSPSVCDTAGLGTNFPLTKPMLSTYGNSPAQIDPISTDPNFGTASAVCYFPSIDTSTKHSGTGALHIPFSPNSRTIPFDTMFEGADADNTKTWDVARLLNKSLWFQYYYRTHNMVRADWSPASIAGFKSFIGFAEQVTSSDVTSVVNVTNAQRATIFIDYNHLPAPTQTDPHEPTIFGQLYVQAGSLCPYSGSGDYSSAACIKLQDDTWNEMTTEVGFLPSAFDGVVSGTTLTSASNPFVDGSGNSVNLFSVYIVGKGVFPVASVTNAGSITLASAPGNASGLTVYVSNVYGNSFMRAWVNGQLIDTWSMRTGWGQLSSGVPTKLGFAQFELLMQSTAASGTHTVGDGWWDDLIISTQPIAFGSDIAAPTCTPTHLAFTGQPSNANVGATLGLVSVAAQDASNITCISDFSTITIANKAGTCTGMTLGGTSSGSSGGTLSTSNLTESAAGACTLHATDGALTAADSTAFTISGGGMDTLAFSSQPTNVVSGSSFSPPVTVTASLSGGGTDTTFTGNILLSMSACGAASIGTFTQAAVAGVAAFPGLGASNVATGCTFTANNAGMASVTSAPFNVTAVVTASGSGRGVLRKR